jgi:alkylhydroperoxidase family enzyme
MARIPLVDPDDRDAPGREPLLRARQEMGGDNNFFLAVGNNPQILEGLLGLGSGVYFGRHIGPKLTELAYLTASAVNACHY